MSPSYRFELATEKYDCAQRAILRSTFMSGEISLSFQRNPGFFVGERAGNLDSQIIAVRDAATDTIVGLGCSNLVKQK